MSLNLREIDGVVWCPVSEVIQGLDILEEYLSNGAEIKKQHDGGGYWSWIISDEKGEVLYMGSTIRELLVNIILGG